MCGHPLISYTVAAGLSSRHVTDLIVSTDSEEIAEVARAYGALVPFMRPAALAEDHIFSRDAVHHAVIETERVLGRVYDYVVEIPGTAPLRDGEDIDRALERTPDSTRFARTSCCSTLVPGGVRIRPNTRLRLPRGR